MYMPQLSIYFYLTHRTLYAMTKIQIQNKLTSKNSFHGQRVWNSPYNNPLLTITLAHRRGTILHQTRIGISRILCLNALLKLWHIISLRRRLVTWYRGRLFHSQWTNLTVKYCRPQIQNIKLRQMERCHI